MKKGVAGGTGSLLHFAPRLPLPLPRPCLIFLASLTALAGGGALRATEPPKEAVAFIDRYCAACHNDTDLKGRLDLTSLAYEPENRANFALWVKVHDRVQAG